MSSKYMYHPKGGYLSLACKSHSKAELEKLGWTECDLDGIIKDKMNKMIKNTNQEPEFVLPVGGKAENVNEKSLAEQYNEKFGKYPHHRMKEDTIKAALME